MRQRGRTPRQPATKFPNLRKKLVKNEAVARRLKKRCACFTAKSCQRLMFSYSTPETNRPRPV